MVIILYLGLLFQPKCIVILCMLNFLFLMIFYAFFLSYIEDSVNLDDIVYKELLKIMDPNLMTVEQMANMIHNYNPSAASAKNISQKWTANKCNMSRSDTLAIIVPYRNRRSQLQILVQYLDKLLTKQMLCYHIYIVEQYGDGKFNKGLLMNAGFLEAMKLWKFDCIMFHDVDLIPENFEVPYSCSRQPIHVSVSVDTFDYKLPYSYLVGGVLVMQVNQFILLNGYSNMYWDWGAEDDDLYIRINATNLQVTRPLASVARFRMLRHKVRQKSPIELRHKLLYISKARYRLDGLNSVSYTLLQTTYFELYTQLLIDVGPSPF